MRMSWLALVSVITCGASAALCTAAEPPQVRVDSVVRLDGPDALARLQVSNPRHYAKAIKIIDAATQICRVDNHFEDIPVGHGLVAPEQGQAQAKGQPQGTEQPQETASASCVWGLWMTSFPPKRELRFTLDHTIYIAVVSVPMDTKLIPTQTLGLRSTAPQGSRDGQAGGADRREQAADESQGAGKPDPQSDQTRGDR
jgi:hypothetical protein